ncbi:hypothetical protein ACFYXM_10005 [Streptomyces sp. NPDC002476]|uniref:hypothetical protein n=1 Tax=Streptomyces sp. NPDC002476 TaxID=3364648 RepID=UPI0036891AB3
MTCRAGEPFALARALADVEALLTAPLPGSGPVVAEGDPETGEWTGTDGDGFRVVPLWEGDALTGVYAPEWNDAQEAAEAHLAALAAELDRLWGPHHAVVLHVPLLRRQEGARVDPLFEALFRQDLYGDLVVWGPVGGTGRWAGVTVGHSDGDAPLVLAALVSDRPVTAPDDDR